MGHKLTKQRAKLVAYIVAGSVGISVLTTSLVSKETTKEKNTPRAHKNIGGQHAASNTNPKITFQGNWNYPLDDTIEKNLSYLSELETEETKGQSTQNIIAKEVVYHEDKTYSIRTIFKTDTNHKMLSVKTFLSDLTPISQRTYKADVIEIDVFPSHYPNPPMYPPPSKDQQLKVASRSKSNKDLKNLESILKKQVQIIPTGAKNNSEYSSTNASSGLVAHQNLNEGYRILVETPNTPSELFELYSKLQNIAGNSGVVKLQSPTDDDITMLQ